MPIGHDIDWRAAVQQVVWVPAAHRNATVPRPTAMRMLRCSESSFVQLCELGLPSEDGVDGPLYDDFDLKNAALHSRSGLTEVEISMGFLLDFLRQGPGELTRPVRRRFALRLTASGGTTARRVYRPTPESFGGELHDPPVVHPWFTMVPGAVVEGSLTNVGVYQRVRSNAIRALVGELLDSGVRWQYMPTSLVLRPAEAFAGGAASCAVLCSMLVGRLAEAGFAAVAYHGWIIAATQVDHGWVEVLDEDGVTKCLDPSLALLAVRYGFGTEEFAAFAVGSMQNRVMPTRAPLNHPFVVNGNGSEVVSLSCQVEPMATSGRRRDRLRRQHR